jgi:hypothetical protein
MKRTPKRKLRIVTGLESDRTPVLEERTVDGVLEVLCRRANRLVKDREIREALRPALKTFVHNVVGYFRDSGELDDYTTANILTALITADSHGPSQHGVEDYSTFIRRLNPTDPNADTYFVIGRAGRINDPDCPLKEMEQQGSGLSNVPAAQLHMFHAFHYARSIDTGRDAPKIQVEDFRSLVPQEIVGESALEEAFLEVCFSDGAWELYQLKLAA